MDGEGLIIGLLVVAVLRMIPRVVHFFCCGWDAAQMTAWME